MVENYGRVGESIYSGRAESKRRQKKNHMKLLFWCICIGLFDYFIQLTQYEQTKPLENYGGPAIFRLL